ncbi:MAG TPA: PBP1A family penicillin-binding protein [Arcobacter sp.]|nr:PBP1A family penicillin-binding protein [Arcobacter sp.]
MFRKIVLFFIFIGLGVSIWLIVLYSQIRFDVNNIVDYNPKLTSQLFDKNDKLIANIFQKEHRFYVKFDDIPPQVIEALVAIEDTQFFEHAGINPDAILRAVIKDLKHMKLVEGASTLTQQLVKTMTLTREKKLMRKIKEVLLSLRLETILSKEEILERYLNEVFFGHGYYGIKTAAYGYFKKNLHQLNLKEIAILVGLPKAPSFYDPTRNLKFSLSRANQVITRLKTLGWINEKEYEAAINFKPKIYNESLSQNKAPYVVDSAIKELSKDIKDIKTGGYKIKLTIDLNAQKIARDALTYGYNKIIARDLKKDNNISTSHTLNGGIIVMENHSGAILALVGGVDYKKSSFNRVTQTLRQPGSSIKPFLYQSALNNGYSTMSQLVDISRTYEYKSKQNKIKKWQPQNYENNYKGLIPLRYSLVHSRNLATINLVTEIGIDVIYKSLKNYGFKDIPYDLSITLGSFGISPFNLSSIYSIFSNNGVRVTPYLIDSITNNSAQTIQFEPEKKYIMPKEQTFLLTSILKEVVTSGTGRNAQVKGLDTAGKTGTTNNNVDAWFCGYSPTIQTIVWYGNDDNKPMGRRETGGRTAAPAFSFFYKEWLKIHPEIKRKFTKPEGVKSTLFNGEKEYFTDKSPMPEISNTISKDKFDTSIEF